MSALRAKMLIHVDSGLLSVTSSTEDDRQSDTHSPSKNTHALRRGQSSSSSQFRHRRGNQIDYSKYKTKMCRHYLNGVQCPFRSRCAFAHGDESPTTPSAAKAASSFKAGAKATALPPYSPLDPKARAYTPEAMSFTGEEMERSDKSGDFQVRSGSNTASGSSMANHQDAPPPPYEEAVREDEDCASPQEYLPPAYPRRFRHNPYSLMSSIVYQCA